MAKYLLILSVLYCFGACKKFEAVDFKGNCSDPKASIEAKIGANLRYEFSVNTNSSDPKSELIRVYWTIDGNKFTGSKISYQFDKKGTQTIAVEYYNRCLVKGTTSQIINL